MNQAITDARLEELSLISKLEQLKLGASEDSESCLTFSKSADQVDTQSSKLTTSLSGTLATVTSEHLTKIDSSVNSFDRRGTSENVDSVDRQYDKIYNEDCMTQLEVTFDPEKCVCSSVEGGQSLIHSAAGKGYGLASIAITSGCYYWKVFILFYFQF